GTPNLPGTSLRPSDPPPRQNAENELPNEARGPSASSPESFLNPWIRPLQFLQGSFREYQLFRIDIPRVSLPARMATILNQKRSARQERRGQHLPHPQALRQQAVPQLPD